jgi:hypothetical protein
VFLTLFQPVALPNIRSKPAYEELLGALEGLAIQPTSWDGSSTDNDAEGEESKAAHKFLVDVIKSGLYWIDGDEGDGGSEREALLEVASKRLTERCGRAGMSLLSAYLTSAFLDNSAVKRSLFSSCWQ